MEDAAKKSATPQLEPERFKLAEHERNIWVITIEQGITRKQILDPAFLAHVAPKCRPYDEILIRCDDGSIFVRAIVLQAERTWVRLHITEWNDLTTKDIALTQSKAVEEGAEAAKFKVVNRGPHKKWCVQRTSDNELVREGESTKQEAQTWLDGYLKVIA